MSYVVSSSEKTRKKGADTETKALLYLMNLRDDSDEIYYYIVDFFNDLTGMDRIAENLWDLQSKGAANNAPKAIGKELVTLYKNYISDFDFCEFILFLGGVSTTVRVDDSKNIFKISNITDKSKDRIIAGLKEEASKKEYINSKDIIDSKINDFLDKVTFVIDDKDPSEYVKEIIKEHSLLIPEEKVLNSIFNEVRDKQSSKKNIQVVEGKVIQTKSEALNYFRHLTSTDIRLLALQRIINRNPIEQGIPISFLPILQTCPPERRDDIIQQCQISLTRALFNKNSAETFWSLLESIYSIILDNPSYDIDMIYCKIDRKIKKQATDFDVFSFKYFIANVRDGIKNDYKKDGFWK